MVVARIGMNRANMCILVMGEKDGGGGGQV